jgi:hypothetical protein
MGSSPPILDPARGGDARTRKPSENEPQDDTTADEPMTREEWLAYHVARAPRITPQQWADTLLLLHTRNQEDNGQPDEEKAS